MKIKEIYLPFNKKGELTKNFCTFGQTQTFANGCVNLNNLIIQSKELITKLNEINLEMEELFKDFKKNKETIKELDCLNNNLYNSYYNIIHAILKKEEIEKIQTKIGYNFISENFISEMIQHLESEAI